MKKAVINISIIMFFSIPLYCQISINTDGSKADSSSILDIKSSSQGLLIPRMTFEQRNAIQNPSEGLFIYCVDCNSNGSGTFSVFQNGLWKNILLDCALPNRPMSGTHIPGLEEITWRWSTVPIARLYKWGTTNDFNSAIDLGTDTIYHETGLSCWTLYTRYVWASNDCGHASPRILTQSTSMDYIESPEEGSHLASESAIIWAWTPVAGATGYRWGVANNFELATNTGNQTTYTETGLACGTSFTRYAWAYFDCGYSQPVTLTMSTTWICGCTLIIPHSAGSVAPVTKTVTYYTVSNIPGEPLKCWITQNLGADYQADSVSDPGEPPAGWYWQFNRMQGFKHDGTTRIPSTAWISVIDESSDWIIINDPCQIELGNSWRIPTYTEYWNIDNAGNWTDWNGPWSSSLKLHAAGGLGYSNGNIYNRGSYGYYWSSSRETSSYAYKLRFRFNDCFISDDNKANAFSIRCISEQ